MQFASSALVMFFAALLALWPLVFLVAVLRHLFAKRWRRVGQVALLLPLWTIAASVGLVQLGPFMAALDAPSPPRSPFMAVTAIGFALCCAAVAWGLLIRSFGGEPSLRPGQEPPSPGQVPRT
jgi:hypothetical protein